MTARRPVTLMLLCVFLLAACADAPSGSGDGSPSGPDPTNQPSASGADVILRLSYEGGFVPAGFPLLDVPAFTLYGDGTVITPGAQIAIYPPPALPAIVERTADEAAIAAIVERARDAGLGEEDLDLRDTGNVAVADAATAVFTLTLDGRTTTAEVYAMGLDGEPTTMPGLSDDQVELRRALSSLAADLGDLTWVEEAGGSLGDESAYVGEAARLLVGPVREDPELPQESFAWPIGLPLRTLGEPTDWDPETRCAVLEGEDWRAVYEAAGAANQLTPWSDGRTERTIAFRPLLPGESGC
jgi:hypothetical protein